MRKQYYILVLVCILVLIIPSISADTITDLKPHKILRISQQYHYPSRFDPDQRLTIPDVYDFDARSEIRKTFIDSRDEIVGRYAGSALWSGMKDVAYADGLAYCVMEYGLVIVDVGDPSSPILVSQLRLPSSEVWSIFLSDDKAYIANGSYGLQEVDISDPLNPLLGDTYDTEGYAVDVVISGNIAYVADGNNGLTIIDLIENNHAGGFITPSVAQAVTVAGNQAYLACGNGGLQIIDISDLENPLLLSGLSSLGRVLDVDVVGDFAYAACGESDLKIIDISSPEAPIIKGGSVSPGGANAVQVRGNFAYVTYGSPYGLQVIDITDPDKPVTRASLNIAGASLGMAFDEDIIFVAGWQSGLQVVNIADPGKIYLRSSYSPPGAIFSLAAADDFAYVTGTNRMENKGTLRILDISDRNNPHETGMYISNGPLSDVVVFGDYAYLAAIDEGLLVLNIANPENPYKTGGINTAGQALELVVDGGHAYVAADSGGLHLIDITDPLNPVLAGSYQTEGSCVDVEVIGNRAYMVDIDNGLRILDISNNNSPLLIGGYDISGRPREIAVNGDYAYLCGEEFGLAIVDISDPGNPFQVSTLPLEGSAVEIEIGDGYAFICDVDNGLMMIDIDDPSETYLAGCFATDGYAWDVEVFDDQAVIADYFGLIIASLERPEFAHTPDSLYFEAYQDGQPPPAQNLILENAGAGNLNWLAFRKQAWLSLTPSSSTAPSQISVQVLSEGLIEGMYHDTITIMAKATNSPLYIPVSLYLKPPNYSPALDAIGPKSIDEDNELIFTVSALDPDGTIPRLEAKNSPVNSGFEDHGDGSGTFSFNADYTQAGEYQVVFYAYDALDEELYDSEIVLITVHNVNRTPTFDITFMDTLVIEDEEFELIIRASDPDNEQLAITCYSKPEEAVFHDSLNGVGLLTFISSYKDVDYDYLLGFEVSDSEGAKDRDSLTLSVGNRQLEVTDVQAGSPQTGWADILIDDSIQIVFNEGIEPQNLDELLSLTSAKGDQLIFNYNPDVHSIYIKNNADYFIPLDTISILLSADVIDLAGYPLGEELSHVMYIGAAVYSGDTNNDGIVDERDILPLGLYWESIGPIRNEIPDCSWEMEAAHLWDPIEATYADVDGSGVVDAADICGVTENWASSQGNGLGKSYYSKLALSGIRRDVLIELYEGLVGCPESDGKKILKNTLEELINRSSASLPRRSELYQNHPNPFNPSTNIGFYLSHAGQASLTIYNIRGQKVATLLDGHLESGFYEILWNGSDQFGRMAASGIYLYRLQTDQDIIIRRMILLK